MEEHENVQARNGVSVTRWTRLELKQGQFEHIVVNRFLVDVPPKNRLGKEI